MGSGSGQKMSLTFSDQQDTLETTTGDNMKVGTLVKIKRTDNERYLNKLAIVVRIGTWSVDVRIIDKNSTWESRIARDKLEVIACK